MYIEIGAFDAKAQLSKLLQEVQHGKRYTITIRGKPIADLVPSESIEVQDVASAIEKMRAIKKIKGVTNKELTSWIAEGRK